MSNQLKRLHDKLLEAKPEGATHDKQSCELCAETFDTDKGVSVDDQPEGGSMSEETKTYTENELQSAVAKAVDEATSELSTKLNELQNSLQQSDIDKAVAEVTAASEESIKELQSKLDVAVLEAETEKKAREELEAAIEAKEKAEKDAEELEAKKAERIDAVNEVASFPEQYLNENSERWALMSDDEFAKCIEDWKLVASKSNDDDGAIPSKTAMTASREEGGNTTTDTPLSYLGELRRELVGKSL